MARFYPIIDHEESRLNAGQLASALAQAGCDLIQVRGKSATSAEFFALAREVVLSAGRAARVIVNDRMDIALAAGASGVHLGESDLPVDAVRGIAPGGFIIGATARDPESAVRAQGAGADYIGAGAVFPTGSKSDTCLIGLEGLRQIALAVRIPVYGIAGINLANCSQVVEAGAYGCAGITAISRAPDPALAFRLLEETLRDAARKRF